MPTDAEQHDLDAIAEDCQQIFGPGIELDGLDRIDEPAGGVRLAVRYRLATVAAESTAIGDTVIDAHARVREQLVVDRLRLAFTGIVESDR